MLDNGHTVQVNFVPGNAIEVLGRRYELTQFHFHRPSEEKVNGQRFDMVAHLVHKSDDGQLAVIAVLLERGNENPFIQMLWNNLPLEKNSSLVVRSSSQSWATSEGSSGSGSMPTQKVPGRTARSESPARTPISR